MDFRYWRKSILHSHSRRKYISVGRVFYRISCSRPSNSGPSKNCFNVRSSPSQSFLIRTMEMLRRDGPSCCKNTMHFFHLTRRGDPCGRPIPCPCGTGGLPQGQPLRGYPDRTQYECPHLPVGAFVSVSKNLWCGSTPRLPPGVVLRAANPKSNDCRGQSHHNS